MDELGIKIVSEREAVMLEDQAIGIKTALCILISLAKFTKQKDPKKQEMKNAAVLDFAYEIYKDI